jgi:hypothetical protein
MPAMESSIVHILKYVAIFAFVPAFVALPLFAINWFRYESSRRGGSRPFQPFPVISLSVFAGSALLLLVISETIASQARSEVTTFIRDANGAKVTVNGEVVADPAPILRALRWVLGTMPHHSLPTTPLHVVIRGKNGSLELDLARDSARPREYWVFYPAGQTIRAGSEIGRVESEAFDAY